MWCGACVYVHVRAMCLTSSAAIANRWANWAGVPLTQLAAEAGRNCCRWLRPPPDNKANFWWRCRGESVAIGPSPSTAPAALPHRLQTERESPYQIITYHLSEPFPVACTLWVALDRPPHLHFVVALLLPPLIGDFAAGARWLWAFPLFPWWKYTRELRDLLAGHFSLGLVPIPCT